MTHWWAGRWGSLPTRTEREALPSLCAIHFHINELAWASGEGGAWPSRSRDQKGGGHGVCFSSETQPRCCTPSRISGAMLTRLRRASLGLQFAKGAQSSDAPRMPLSPMQWDETFRSLKHITRACMVLNESTHCTLCQCLFLVVAPPARPDKLHLLCHLWEASAASLAA